MSHEYETMIDFYAIFVDKDGGGTVGKSYEGDWTVTVSSGDAYLMDNAIIGTGTPKTHAQVARLAADFTSEHVAEEY